MQLKPLVLALGLSSFALLTACGGGGGGGTPTPTPVNDSRLSLAGVVSKGVIANGVVIATENGKEIGRTSTNADGKYVLPLDGKYNGGLVKVEVRAQAGSTLLCDAPAGCNDKAFGEKIALDSVAGSFSLTAIVKPVGNTVTLPVTALTHMAAQRAVTLGLTEENVRQANAAVSELAGFDILATEPANINSADSVKAASVASQAYAIFNSGLASLVFSGSGSLAAATTNINNLASSFAKDGRVENAQTLVTAVSGAKDAALKNPAVGSVITAGAGKVSGNLQQISAGVDTSGGFKPSEPTVPVTTGTALERGKKSIATARAWVTQVEDTDWDAKFRTMVPESVQKSVKDDMAKVSTALSGLFAGMDSSAQGSWAKALRDNGSNTLALKDSNGANLGTLNVSFSGDANGSTLTINTAAPLSNGVTVQNLVLKTSVPKTAFNQDALGVFTGFTADKGSVSLSGSISAGTAANATTLKLNQVSASIAFTKALTFKEEKSDAVEADLSDSFNGLTLKGDVSLTSAGHSFNGKVEVDTVRLTPKGSWDAHVGLRKLAVSGDFTAAGGDKLQASAELVIQNGATFDALGLRDAVGEGYVWFNLPGKVTELHEAVLSKVRALEPEGASIEINHYSFNREYWAGTLYSHGAVSYTSNGQSKWKELSVLDAEELNAQLAPAYRRQTGLPFSLDASSNRMFYARYSKGGCSSYSSYCWPENTYTGLEIDPSELESADLFLKGYLSVNTTVSLKDLPTANASATLTRNDYNKASLSLSLKTETGNYEFEAGSDDIHADNQTISYSITNNSGFSMTGTALDGATGHTQFTGTVKVDGTQVGAIVMRGKFPAVKWSDGTFESLN